MAMDPDRNPQWLRFRLRTLFLLTAIVAVVSWVYWGGWETWRIYREQMRFEADVKQLVRGTIIPQEISTAAGPTSMGTYKAENGKTIGFMRFEWPSRGLYVVYFPLSSQDGTFDSSNCMSVEVYRFPYVHWDYEAKTKRAREEVVKALAVPHSPKVKVMGYWYDILEYLSGDRRDKLGLKYKLIHADVPATMYE